MADLENPILPGGAGGEHDDPEAATAEEDDESTLWCCLSLAFGCLVMTALFVLLLRFCRSDPTIMDFWALGIFLYAVAVAGLLFFGCGLVSFIPLFFCGNFFGEPQEDELPT